MNQSVLKTFWFGVWTGSLWFVLINYIISGDTIATVMIGVLFALFVTLSIICIRKTSKEKTINQIIIRHQTEKDMTDELKKFAEVD